MSKIAQEYWDEADRAISSYTKLKKIGKKQIFLKRHPELSESDFNPPNREKILLKLEPQLAPWLKVKSTKQSKLKTKTLSGKESTVMREISKAHKEGDKAMITTDMNVKTRLSTKDKKGFD